MIQFRRSITALLLVIMSIFAMVLPGSVALADTPTPPSQTCITWVHSALAPYVVADPIDGDYIQLEPTQWIPVDSWCILFGDSFASGVPADPYAALSDPVIHQFVWTDGLLYALTATEMGHQVFIDQWHAELLF